jgi:hypothetical protein
MHIWVGALPTGLAVTAAPAEKRKDSHHHGSGKPSPVGRVASELIGRRAKKMMHRVDQVHAGKQYGQSAHHIQNSHRPSAKSSVEFYASTLVRGVLTSAEYDG